ncbi:phosphoadenylyl-sulfate reductase [Alicyclobacillus cycloheptanicus]|uniref:phosphoadenylyl-sulfate reductase n=1 Tax=Alicyclobacillus cycloheptanicus TaxID=1457 RepID=UPI0027A54D00|nr:phosphoadenylyl-sulfate reductase [Alicyclobacillus cycloheptanicus]WDM02929.1 phosphoadenylyl-sulfate reductase [Alicyclobacillus cycloheptanicus]
MDARKDQLNALAAEYEGKDPREILKAAHELVPNLALACSFGAEDMVLLDMWMQVNPQGIVFYIDTDVLFPETYALRDEAVARYGIPNLVRISSKLTLEAQAEQYGEALWARDPNQCCNLRKVEPLQRALTAYDGWITGIRRDQAPTRANARVFEWDQKFNLVKVNPLAAWSWDNVWDYIRDNHVPYNPLHDQGYPSIGCLHCTRPVKPGEDPRAGRWSGFEKTECGLHK